MIIPQDFDFTQGKLQDYLDCPYRFYLRYILRTQWPALIVDDAAEFENRLQAGARFHRLIQQYLLGIPQEVLSEQAAADTNPDLLAWWEGFLTHVPPWLDGERWVETVLTTALTSRRLVAKYDLILLEKGGGLTIFDWKTSQKSPRVDWLVGRMQTRLYRLVLADAGRMLTGGQAVDPERVKMNYWFAPHPKTPVSLPYSQSAYDQDREDLARLLEEILTADVVDFTRTEDHHQCRFCVYRSHCDRGIQAGDLADFDTFEFEAESTETIPFEDIPEVEV